MNRRNEKAITLIALVVTIVVLLILAGVSISMLTGENGIIKQAQDAKTATEKAEAKEQAKLDIMAWRTNEIANGRNGALDDATVKTILDGKDYVDTVAEDSFTTKEGHTIVYKDLYTSKTPTPPSGDEIVTVAPTTAKVEKNTKYQDASSGNKIAVIPTGFSVVPGCTTIDDGLVISDVANDTGNTGNQFVWIPVDKNNFEKEFVRRAGYSNDSLQDISINGEVNRTGVNTNTSITETPETQAEAIAMYDSVETNGGFYIGRYEAGKETVTLDDGTSTTKVVVKKGADVYNNIKWGNGMTNEIGGAVELARNFASVNGYDTTKVHSTLCYGVQWDTALNFIDPGYTGYAKDSSKKGWYSDNYNSTSTDMKENNPNHITGKDLIYMAKPDEISNMHKNIYDMGGNVWEWTMEAENTTNRACRGGSYDWDYIGSFCPASNRANGYGIYPSFSNNDIGLRIALYL